MADPELWKKWAGRDRLNPTGWAPAPPAPQITTVIPLEQEWRYTTEQPKDDWTQPGFDDSSWKTGRAGFGVTPNEHSLFARHTEWNTKDIWLRREFVMPEKDHPDLHFLIYHNANTEVYLNGVRAIAPGGHVSAPVPEEIPEGVRRELKPGAKVKIAVHCKWWWGLQGVDVGLADVIFPPELRDE